MRKESVSRESVELKSKRRKLHASSKTSEEPKRENRDNVISKRESVYDKRDKLLPKLKRMRKVKQKMANKMRMRPRSKTKRTLMPRTTMRGKRTTMMLRLRILKTKLMKLKVVMMPLIRRQLTKKLTINKKRSNLKRMAKKIPESLKILCLQSLRDVVVDQNKMLNSVVSKRQRAAAAEAEAKVLKWSIGLKSKLLQKLVRMLKEMSKKSVQRIMTRTLRLPELKL